MNSNPNFVVRLANFRAAQQNLFEIGAEKSHFFLRNFERTITEFRRNLFAFFLHSTHSSPLTSWSHQVVYKNFMGFVLIV